MTGNPYAQWLHEKFRQPDPWRFGEITSSQRWDAALRLLPPRLGSTLEIGCAEGHFTPLLADRSSEVVAVDLVAAATDRARCRLAPLENVRVERADLTRHLPLRWFDAVVCMDVMYYVPERMGARVRDRIRRRVRPDGVLLLQHELDAIVREWDTEQGGAESIHTLFECSGWVIEATQRDDDVETVLLRRLRGSLLGDAGAELLDRLRDPWQAASPDSGWTRDEIEVTTGAVTSEPTDGQRRLLVRVGGRAVDETWWSGSAEAPDEPAAPLAARSACHLSRMLADPIAGDDDVARRLTSGQVPHHPLSSTPRALLAGEVLVVVCTNRPPEVAEPLLRQLRPELDVLVIENGNTEPLLAQLCAALDAGHHHDRRPGLAAARNRAFALSEQPWLVFLDDDCRLAGTSDDFAARVGGAIDAIESTGAVSGLVLPERLDSDAAWLFEDHASHGRGWVPRHHHIGSDGDPRWPLRHADWMGVGACMAVRRAAWEDVGGFDERLGAGTLACSAEDDAFFRALVERDWSVFYEPGIHVRHIHRQTLRALRVQLFGYGAGRSVHVMLRAADLRDPSLVRLWWRLLREDWPAMRERGWALGAPEVAGYLAGPLLAARTLWGAR